MIPLVGAEGQVVGEVRLILACVKVNAGPYIWRFKIYADARDKASVLKFALLHQQVRDPSGLIIALPYITVLHDAQPEVR